MSRLAAFQSHQIPYVWDKVKDHIQRGLDRGSEYTLDDIFVGLCNREFQLWISSGDGIEAAMVTSIQTDRQGITFCLLLAVGGENMNEWKNFLPQVEQWAKDEGATEMRIFGRRGWARALGYDIKYTAIGKTL